MYCPIFIDATASMSLTIKFLLNKKQVHKNLNCFNRQGGEVGSVVETFVMVSGIWSYSGYRGENRVSGKKDLNQKIHHHHQLPRAYSFGNLALRQHMNG